MKRTSINPAHTMVIGLANIADGLSKVVTLGFYSTSLSFKATVWAARQETKTSEAKNELYVEAPWTDDQVENLNRFQHDGRMHEFTCECRNKLTATNDGWVCSECDYTQNWAAPMMTEFTQEKQAELNNHFAKLRSK